MLTKGWILNIASLCLGCHCNQRWLNNEFYYFAMLKTEFCLTFHSACILLLHKNVDAKALVNVKLHYSLSYPVLLFCTPNIIELDIIWLYFNNIRRFSMRTKDQVQKLLFYRIESFYFVVWNVEHLAWTLSNSIFQSFCCFLHMRIQAWEAAFLDFAKQYYVLAERSLQGCSSECLHSYVC